MPEKPADCPLTEAEPEVLQASLDAAGATNARLIAESLGTSPETVRTQWRNILAKLGLHERGQAVLHAANHGWVTRRIPAG